MAKDNKKVNKCFKKNKVKPFITVNKKKYAVGIFWQPFKDPDHKKKEVSYASANIVGKMDLFCEKDKGVKQYGLASSSKGFSTGMPIAATGVFESLSDKTSSVCVFKVPEGYWFLAIRSDLILPEEDRIIEDEREAKQAFENMLTVPDWGYRIAPASWGIKDTNDMSLEGLLKKTTDVKLKKVNDKALMTVGLLLAILVGGFLVMKTIQKQKEAKEEERRLARGRLLRQQQLKKKQEEQAKLIASIKIEAPWEKLKDNYEMAFVCFDNIRYFYEPFAGWKFKTAICNGKNVKVKWNKSYGKSDWVDLAREWDIIPRDVKLKVTNENTIGLLDVDVPAVSSKPNMNLKKIKKFFDKFFEDNSLKGKFIENSKTLGVDKDKYKDKGIPLESLDKKEVFKYIKFSFEYKKNPVEVNDKLSDLRGFEFTSIKWDNGTRSWYYEGIVYEKK